MTTVTRAAWISHSPLWASSDTYQTTPTETITESILHCHLRKSSNPYLLLLRRGTNKVPQTPRLLLFLFQRLRRNLHRLCRPALRRLSHAVSQKGGYFGVKHFFNNRTAQQLRGHPKTSAIPFLLYNGTYRSSIYNKYQGSRYK